MPEDARQRLIEQAQARSGHERVELYLREHRPLARSIIVMQEETEDLLSGHTER